MKYVHITVGGTFDLFHEGHKAFLARAFEVGETVWLGITTDTFASQKISNYETRKNEVVEYIKKNGWLERVKIIPLQDKFGTTLTDDQIEAIVVSPETEPVAREINILRRQLSLTPLAIVVVPWVLASDNLPIHSTRIRNGEIDREGNVYGLPENWGVRTISDEIRLILKQPTGFLIADTSKNHEEAVRELINNFKFQISNFKYPISQKKISSANQSMLITVGDAVTDAFLKENVIPDVSIVDLLIQRKQVYQNIEELGFRDIKVHKIIENPAGTLSYKAFNVLNNLIKREAKPSVLQVVGEEDLLGLFAVFCAPLGSLIVYGQPHEGIVVIEVDEEKKQLSRKYLEQFIK